MQALAQLYRFNETNIGLRRQFLRFGQEDVRVLRKVARWADRVADPIAQEFYDHQFDFGPTLAFFTAYAREHEHSLEDLRSALEKAQAGYFRDIFKEAAGSGRFGVDYFERRLHVGRVHNAIDLPIKWYVGSYAAYFDLARKHLRRRYPHRPRLRAKVERSLICVFNADMQAIVEAFYFDTFTAMGVDLEPVAVDRAEHDLSDRGGELKAMVKEPLDGIAKALASLRSASGQLASSSEQTGRAIAEIANAVSSVAQGAERQVTMVEETSRTAAETATAAGEARTASAEGIAAAERATRAMEAVRASSGTVNGTMISLAEKSEQIGGIVETINGIAEQTTLLALNAAIEAARAGEQGRGFAVVADEVRKLAEESQHAATRIADLVADIRAETAKAVEVVEGSVSQTEEGATVVAEARDAFGAIGARVDDIVARIEQITSATAAVAEQSSASAEQVSASTQETSASTQQVAASAHELARTAEELESIVGKFKLEVT